MRELLIFDLQHWTADYDFIPLIQTYQYEAYLETGTSMDDVSTDHH